MWCILIGMVGVVGAAGDDIAVGDKEELGFPFQTAEEAGAKGEVVEAVGVAGCGGGGGCGGSACTGGIV